MAETFYYMLLFVINSCFFLLNLFESCIHQKFCLCLFTIMDAGLLLFTLLPYVIFLAVCSAYSCEIFFSTRRITETRFTGVQILSIVSKYNCEGGAYCTWRCSNRVGRAKGSTTPPLFPHPPALM
jgi:hypothetical protein